MTGWEEYVPPLCHVLTIDIEEYDLTGYIRMAEPEIVGLIGSCILEAADPAYKCCSKLIWDFYPNFSLGNDVTKMAEVSNLRHVNP